MNIIIALLIGTIGMMYSTYCFTTFNHQNKNNSNLPRAIKALRSERTKHEKLFWHGIASVSVSVFILTYTAYAITEIISLIPGGSL